MLEEAIHFTISRFFTEFSVFTAFQKINSNNSTTTMEALQNLTLAQIRALLKRKEQEEWVKSAEYKEKVAEAKAILTDLVSNKQQLQDLIMGVATECGIDLKKKKNKGSGCRFNLRRKLDGRNQPLYFIMLNPSNADATDCEKNDPTIKECIKHANARSAREIQVVNLFPVVTSRPEKLDHILIEQNLEENNKELSRTFYEAEKNKQPIICAWGNPTKIKKNNEIYSLFKKQVDHIKNLAKKHNINLKCIGTTKEGNPKHPLGPKRCGHKITHGYIEQFTIY